MAPVRWDIWPVIFDNANVTGRVDVMVGSGNAPNAVQARDISAANIHSGLSDRAKRAGIGVGMALLAGIIVAACMIVRKKRVHKRQIEAMEVEEARQAARTEQTEDAPRPANTIGCTSLLPVQSRAGWTALSSDEAVNELDPLQRDDRRKRSSVSLPKRLKQRGIPLKKLKRLTAILESPRSRTMDSPAIPALETMPATPGANQPPAPQSGPKPFDLQHSKDDDVFVCPGSPKLDVLPSFAIRSPGRYGAGIANDETRKTYRSRSVGAMPVNTRDTLSQQSSRRCRTSVHGRSVSLGAPPSRPPSGPVPPLPVIDPHDFKTQDSARQGVCVQRISCSSQESGNSSVLVATPILMISEQSQSLGSPTVEQVVADDESASLRAVVANKWNNPQVSGPRQLTETSPSKGSKSHISIHSNIVRYSAERTASRHLSLASAEALHRRLSVAQIGVADQISISRVSSTNSLHSSPCVRKVITPRRSRRTSVSSSGSPVERKKTTILRDISGNSIGPSRQPSNATQDSSRSSNGNPFQWDQPLSKPSALKGSPNARKGHRRQNCVRISTLTPQVLGPPPSRPTSPSIMHGIEEESGDGEENEAQPGTRFVENQRLSRPPSTSSFAPNLRLQPLRASLTPSSPTLSAWTTFHEHNLPSQNSDSQLSGSAGTRSASRLSHRSSAFSIPSFPSPIRAVACTTQLSQPVPEFYLSRPSTDIDDHESSSPFVIHPSLDPEIHSSPPLPVSKQDEYDPAWQPVSRSAPAGQEYDPASARWQSVESERSSPTFPFATPAHVFPTNELSPRSRRMSYGGDMPDTPPVSPKTMPEGFQAFFDKTETSSKPARALEKLTSSNASAIMAGIAGEVDFPGAPILPRPEEDEAYAGIAPQSARARQRAASRADAYLIPMRPAPPPPLPSDDGCVPSPLHVVGKKTSPTGPRQEPAQSVLKNAMALRRMNSEIDHVAGRESRRFVHLGREASPLLPWIGSPDSFGDMNELFDFNFAAAAVDAKSGAEQHGSQVNEMSSIEMAKSLDSALAQLDRLLSDGSSSVWEDGEKYWNSSKQEQRIGVARSSPVAIEMTPEKKVQAGGSSTSIQCTPRSFYDSDGFLRT